MLQRETHRPFYSLFYLSKPYVVEALKRSGAAKPKLFFRFCSPEVQVEVLDGSRDPAKISPELMSEVLGP